MQYYKSYTFKTFPFVNIWNAIIEYPHYIMMRFALGSRCLIVLSQEPYLHQTEEEVWMNYEIGYFLFVLFVSMNKKATTKTTKTHLCHWNVLMIKGIDAYSIIAYNFLPLKVSTLTLKRNWNESLVWTIYIMFISLLILIPNNVKRDCKCKIGQLILMFTTRISSHYNP